MYYCELSIVVPVRLSAGKEMLETRVKKVMLDILHAWQLGRNSAGGLRNKVILLRGDTGFQATFPVS